MKRSFIRFLAVFLAVAAGLLPLSAFAEEAGTVSEDYDPLWTLAEPYGFRLGGCFSYRDLHNQVYMDFLARHFNSLTCCNETKAYSLLDQTKSRGASDGMPRMNYTQADRMIAWAQEHNIGIRGHVLVWDAYMTRWFFHEDYDERKPVADKETMRARLASYIEQVITHFETNFPGVIYCWDVVNEAIGGDASEYLPSDPRHLRTKRDGASNCFRDYVGTDYVEFAFLCARNTVEKLGADIRLFYNDYNLFSRDKRIAACSLAKSINLYAKNENGEPRKLIDGIGMQGYIGGYGTQAGCMNQEDITQIRISVKAYASLGLEVQLTEMAIRNYEQKRANQHKYFCRDLFEKALMQINTEESAPLTAVCFWGLVDANPNVKDYSYNINSPYGCLLTGDYKIKTCFDTIYHTLKGD